MRWVRGLCLILASCGGSQGALAVDGGIVFYGKHAVTLHPSPPSGCKLVPADPFTYRVEFNTHGDLMSPYPSINCVTTQPLAVSCDTPVGQITAAADRFGHNWDGGVWASGSGEFVGDLEGCHEVPFTFILR